MSESNTHSSADQIGTGTTDTTPTDTSGQADSAGQGDVIGAGTGNTTEKDPSDWVSGDEPMTGAQRSYLETLARDAGETLSADLTKAEASEHIDRLRNSTGLADS